MDTVLLSLAFAAGMISFLSPCSFPMLPSYIAYSVAQEEDRNSGNPSSMTIYKRALNGASFGSASTLGFITVFSALGATISYGLRQITVYVPLIPIIIGFGLVILGFLMLTNVSLPFSFAIPIKAPAKKGFVFFYFYGIAYALASLGCSLPIFLMIIFGALASGGFAAGILVYLSYSFGMGSLMILVTLTVSAAKSLVVQHFMSLLPYVRKISAVIMIVAGIYMLYYQIFVFSFTMPVIFHTKAFFGQTLTPT